MNARELKQVIQQNQLFIMNLFVFHVLARVLYILVSPTSSWWKGIIYGLEMLFLSVLAAFLLEPLPLKAKRIVQGALLAASAVLCILETVNVTYSQTLINAGAMGVILDTNASEAFSFINLLSKDILAVMAAFIVGCFATYCFCRRFKFKNVFAGKVLLTLCLVGGLLLVREFCIPHHNFMEKEFTSFQRAYYSYQVAAAEQREFEATYEEAGRSVNIIENQSVIPNVVLIIGESTGRNHMGIYGYSLDTTPLLKKMQEEDGLYIFRDVISPHAHTIPVLQKLLTFHNYESIDKWYHQENLIDVVKAAEYRTVWISNQESSGGGGNPSIVMARRCDEKIYTQIRSPEVDNGNYDGALLPLIKQEIEKQQGKNFYVIHLMGAHAVYKNMYPDNFAVFKGSDIHTMAAGGHEDTVSEYDNAILYNDFVVYSIMEAFKDQEAVVLYLSDHGEEVYDYRDFVGHAEENYSRYMLEIPFIAWMSESCKKAYPALDKRFKKAVNRPYMTDDVIHTIFDIMQIKTVDYDERRSVIHENFNADRKRMFHENDYDRDMKQN